MKKAVPFSIIILLFIAGILIYIKMKDDTKRLGGLSIPSRERIETIPFDRQNIYKSDSIRTEQFSDVDVKTLFPPAGDQLEYGSCVAFAIAYSLASYYQKILSRYSYEVVDHLPNQNRVYSPAFVFNGMKGSRNESCEEGIDFITAFDFVRNNGLCKWIDYPYIGTGEACQMKPSSVIFKKARLNTGYEFYRIDRDFVTLRSYVDQGMPLIVGIYTSENMDNEGFNAPKTQNFYWKPDSKDIEDYHAMLCTAYDSKTDCFILLNSWGWKWGVDGYCYIPRSIFMTRFREIYICRLAISSDLQDTTTKANRFLNGISAPNYADSIALFSNNDELDSLMKVDLKMLEMKTNKSKEQERLISEIRRYFKN